MTGLKTDQVLVGNQALIPYQKFDSSVAEAGGDDGGNAGVLAVVPGFYAVKTLGDKFRAGFSVAGPIGGGFDFRDNFVGRYQAYQSSINGIAFSPSLAYRIGDKAVGRVPVFPPYIPYLTRKSPLTRPRLAMEK